MWELFFFKLLRVEGLNIAQPPFLQPRPHVTSWLSISSNPRPMYPHEFNNIMYCTFVFLILANSELHFPRNGINMDRAKSRPEHGNTLPGALSLSLSPGSQVDGEVKSGLTAASSRLRRGWGWKEGAISVGFSFVIREESIRRSFSTKSTIPPNHNSLNYSVTPLWFSRYQKELFRRMR